MGPTVVACVHHFSQIYHFEYLFKAILREIERCIDITVIYNDETLAAIPHDAILHAPIPMIEQWAAMDV